MMPMAAVLGAGVGPAGYLIPRIRAAEALLLDHDAEPDARFATAPATG